MLSFSENISCIIVAGGQEDEQESETVELITEDLGTKQVTNLPRRIVSPSTVYHDGGILLCGGQYNEQKCLHVSMSGTSKKHSTLNQKRYFHSAVKTQTATFLFGGLNSRNTYEYLPKGSTTWLMGKTEIPMGFKLGCAIAVKSDQEIWLIGGLETEKRILSFNVKYHTFKELPYLLKVGRYKHSCAFIPNTKKVMITGGMISAGVNNVQCFDSTEILDTEDESVTMASPMNSMRSSHCISVLTIKGKERLAVLGGYNGLNELDSIETYNIQTEKWEISNLKLSEPKYDFGFLTVKLSDIISELQLECNNTN